MMVNASFFGENLYFCSGVTRPTRWSDQAVPVRSSAGLRGHFSGKVFDVDLDQLLAEKLQTVACGSSLLFDVTSSFSQSLSTAKTLAGGRSRNTYRTFNHELVIRMSLEANGRIKDLALPRR